MSDLAKDELIDGIMKFALEDLVTWSEPLPLKNIGPAYPEEFRKFTDRLEALKEDLRTHLRMLTLHELQNDFPRTTPLPLIFCLIPLVGLVIWPDVWRV